MSVSCCEGMHLDFESIYSQKYYQYPEINVLNI